MDQRTHTWLAVRAVGLLKDTNPSLNLISILEPNIQSTAIGAWIPDLSDARLGSGKVDNHIFKIKPYQGVLSDRFVLQKKDLLKNLGNFRKMYDFIQNDKTLASSWWNESYKADPHPGQHLANRSMALSITLIDLLILGNNNVVKLIPRKIKLSNNLNSNAKSSKEQIATYFFMLSHFIADSCMPCHCDARDLADYDKGLHKELEGHWSKIVTTYFDDKKILATKDNSTKILAEAKSIDNSFGISFDSTLPNVKIKDIWDEVLMICRGSFAVSSIMADPKTYPYNSKVLAPFSTLFGNPNGKKLLDEITKTIMHDAVLNIAIFWKHIWDSL